MSEEKLGELVGWCRPEWLRRALTDPKVVVLDGSYYLPEHKRDAEAEYLAGHIPGAVRFESTRSPTSPIPCRTCCPPPEQFARQVGALGVADRMTIVIYDGVGLYGAARVWWTFRTFGSENVFILDGGMPKWKAGTGRSKQAPGSRARQRHSQREVNRNRGGVDRRMQKSLLDKTAQVVDARPADRFRGEAPEPRPGCAAATCRAPSTSRTPGGRERPAPAARQIAPRSGRPASISTSPVVTSCGSGVTASILTFAIEALGQAAGPLYDGSWSEWGGRQDTPIVKG